MIPGQNKLIRRVLSEREREREQESDEEEYEEEIDSFFENFFRYDFGDDPLSVEELLQ